MLTPREKAAKRLEEAKVAKENDGKIKAIFNAVAATEEGRDLFKYFMKSFGFLSNTVTMNPHTGEVNEKSSVYLEARRSAYLEMRRHILAKHLKKIEF
jgi:hypothetical protein